MEYFGRLDGAQQGTMPDLVNFRFNLVLVQVGSEVFDLLFALAGQAAGGVRLTRFGFRMAQQV